MSQLKFTKRQDLIDALEARRSWAEGYDRRVTAKHKAEEKAVIDAFKKKCSDFARMSASAIKAKVEEERYGLDIDLRMPSCPSSAVAMLDQALALLAVTKQEAFTLSNDNRNHPDPVAGAYWLLTHDDQRVKSTVC